MSLIHDALKKVEKTSDTLQKKDIPKHLEIEEGQQNKPKVNMRTIILIVVLVGSLGYFAYQKIFSKKLQDIAISTVKTEAISVRATRVNERTEEVIKLKESAVKSFKLNNLEDAWVRFSTAGQLDPVEPEIWNNMGLIAKKRGDYEKAHEFYEKALQIKPDYPECLNNIAVIDIENGDYDAATLLLNKAISINEEFPDAYFHLALIAEKKDDLDSAVDYYKKFLQKAKDVPMQLVDEIRMHVTDISTDRML